MIRRLASAVVALGLYVLAGCASSSLPCDHCKWGAKNTPGPRQEPLMYYMADGKMVDCSQERKACPECMKH